LDHEDFDEALCVLTDPLVAAGDLTADQHRAIVVSLLTQGQAKHALKYCRIRKPPMKELVDVQLHVSPCDQLLQSDPILSKPFEQIRLGCHLVG